MQLIVTPEKYANKKVRVTAFVEYDEDKKAGYLWFDHNQYRRGISKNAIKFDLDGIEKPSEKYLTPRYYLVEGTFTPPDPTLAYFTNGGKISATRFELKSKDPVFATQED